MKHGREIVAPPENKAANREHKHQPTLQRLQTTRPKRWIGRFLMVSLIDATSVIAGVPLVQCSMSGLARRLLERQLPALRFA